MATGGSNTPRGPMSFSAIGRGRPANFEPMRPKPTRPITYDQRLFEPGTGLKEGKDGKPVCFDCGRPGHVRRQCPGLDCSWVGQNNEPVKLMGSEREGWEVVVLVNGHEKRALIDTGCSKTLVRQLEGTEGADEVSVRCIHGDSKKYATVWADVQIGSECRRMKVGIAPGLSREMLLGRDWEGASELLNKKEGLIGDCEISQIETDFGKEGSREQTRMWQQDDPTLQEVLKKAQPTGTIIQGQEGFELEEGLLYHVNREGEKQLVVPMKWRKDMLKGEGDARDDNKRTAHSSGGACEGVENKSVPSAEVKVEKEDEIKSQRDSGESKEEKGKETEEKEREVKIEVCLADEEWEESEVTVEGGYKNEEGVVWFSSVVEAYERKKREDRQRAFERVRYQGLLRDFPHLKEGGLLSDPPTVTESFLRKLVKEWNVIVAPRELEIQRERAWMTAEEHEGPDERGWYRHKCCGTICAMRSLPPPQKEPRGSCGIRRL
uniref:CCHC-type domain-containing protein n=1 Tax=Pogona vitticeps TaxID=103695 RepID=A0ABM5GER0_9SAUR